MTHSDPNRLDRIEALVEKIGQRVESNARAIEALSANASEYQRDRSRLYGLMEDLVQSQSRIYRVIEDLDERQGQLSRRQGEIVEILKLLAQRREGSSDP